MLFNSYEFIFLFFPITVVGFYWLGKNEKRKAAIAWLFLASLVYYGWWNPIYLGLIIGSVLFNYFWGCALGRCSKEQQTKSKLLVVLGVTANLALLGYFKYTNFFLDNLNGAFNLNFHVEYIILPLGISFFTFQQIAYLVDAYQGKAREYSFLNYCLFVTFFPQLIAGPIVHHQEILPQYQKSSTYKFDHSNLAIGLTIFTIGLFKKVIIADNLALFATPVFSAAQDGQTLTTLAAWIGTLSYTFQIYFDFSGYSDMAIGLARVCAIKLPLNFNSPYKAVNIMEFWRRWHMTLSRFLKEYLYIPLGGNRQGKIRRYWNLMLVMLIGGLWHGANWTFVLWGGLHGLYLMINHGFRTISEFKNFTWAKTKMFKRVSILITFLGVALAWVLFRAESIPASSSLYMSMFGFAQGGISPYEIEVDQIMAVVVSLIGVWILPNTQEFMRSYEPAFDYDNTVARKSSWKFYWSPSKVWSIVFVLLFIISVINLSKVSEFLYFQF